MASEALGRVRNRLQALVDGASAATPTREIVAAFRAAHGEDIAEASVDLQDIALVKLVDDVSRRRLKLSHSNQGDLFRGFSVPGAILVQVRSGRSVKRMRKSFETATFAEVKAYLERKPETRRLSKDKGIEALLQRVAPFVTSPKMQMSEALAAMKAAESQGVVAGAAG